MNTPDDESPKILPLPKLEPWQEEMYQYLKDTKAKIDLITGIASLDLGRESDNQSVMLEVRLADLEKRFHDAALYGIGYSKQELHLPEWAPAIPDPQAPKPVSSPSKSKREKLRAKRKKRK